MELFKIEKSSAYLGVLDLSIWSNMVLKNLFLSSYMVLIGL